MGLKDPSSGIHKFMSSTAEKIDQEIKLLSPGEQFALSERLAARLTDELPVPKRVRSEAELKAEIREGLKGTPICQRRWKEGGEMTVRNSLRLTRNSIQPPEVLHSVILS